MAALRERARDELRRWLPPRGVRLALPLALAAYALAGFALAPWLVQRQLPGLLADATGGSGSVQEVRVNPFALSAELRGFELRDRAGEPLLGFDRLLVNLELRSLVRWAATFRQVHLVRPWVDVVRAESGAINLEELVPAEDPSKPAPEEDSGLPRVVVDELRIDLGEARVADLTRSPVFRTRLGPLGVSLRDFSTLPNETGQQRVRVTTEHGASVSWRGTLRMQPLSSDGRLSVSGQIVPLAVAYLADRLARQVEPGSLELSLDYHVEAPPGAALSARVRSASLLWRDPVVRTLDEAATDVLRIRELRVAGGELDWPEQQVRVARASLEGVGVHVWREPDGSLSLDRLLATMAPATDASPADAQPADAQPVAEPPAAAAPANPWRVRIAELALVDVQAKVEDRTLQPAGEVAIADLDATVRDVSNAPGARAPLELKFALASGGTLALTGEVTLLPELALTGQLGVSELALGALQPWAGELASVRIAGGSLSVEAKLASNPAELLELDGAVSVTGLDVRDGEDRALVGWRRLAVDRVLAKVDAQAIEVSQVALDAPYVRLLIARDGRTNFESLLREPSPAPPAPAADHPAAAASTPAAAPEPSPLALSVGRVRVRGGSTDFSDLSLVLPFAANVQSLDGEIGSVSTSSERPSRVDLEGQVGEFGLMRVSGSLLAMDPEQSADVRVEFRNVDMPTFTPYSADFAGRRIASGKLTLDLHYALAARQLAGENSITLSDFTLGERVASPNATSLPLDLAIALLKDANGVIDVDVPVTGDLDDPQFGYGRVIWKAIVNLVVGIATSPFRLLGRLVGLEDESLEQLAFEPGRSDLLPPEREKLAKLGEALAQRPQLSLEIAGAFDRERDAAALREARVAARVEARLAAETRRRAKDMLPERELRAIEEISLAAQPELDLKALRKTFTSPPPGEPEAKPRFDETAYREELRKRLVRAEPVSDADLSALASARAESVVAALQGAAAEPSAQLKIGEPKAAEAGELGIPLELAAVTKSE